MWEEELDAELGQNKPANKELKFRHEAIAKWREQQEQDHALRTHAVNLHTPEN